MSQHLLVQNTSLPRPCSRDTSHAPGASWDTGTEGKMCILSSLAPLLLPSYRLATAPYITVSVPYNCFLLMVRGFPPALFVPKIKLTALGTPPPQSAFRLVFVAYCPILTVRHEKHPILNRNTDSPALPCCPFFSHLKILLEALDCSPSAGSGPETLCEGGCDTGCRSQKRCGSCHEPGPRESSPSAWPASADTQQFQIEVWVPVSDKLSP